MSTATARIEALGDALGKVLVKVGVLRDDRPYTGPDLLNAAGAFVDGCGSVAGAGAWADIRDAEVRRLREYVTRLEHYALEGDGYHCDACTHVFDVDEIEFGEDCHLCKPCAAQAREGERPA